MCKSINAKKRIISKCSDYLREHFFRTNIYYDMYSFTVKNINDYAAL